MKECTTLNDNEDASFHNISTEFDFQGDHSSPQAPSVNLTLFCDLENERSDDEHLLNFITVQPILNKILEIF